MERPPTPMAQPEMNVQTREAEAASMPSPEMQFRSSLNSARPSQHPFVSSASASGEDADTIKGVRKPANSDEAVVSQANWKGKVRTNPNAQPYGILKNYAIQNDFQNMIDDITAKIYFAFQLNEPVLVGNIEPRLRNGSRVHASRLFLGEDTGKSYQLWAILILSKNKAASIVYIRLDITTTWKSSARHDDGEKSVTAVASSVEYELLKGLILAYPFSLIAENYAGETTGLSHMQSLIKFVYMHHRKAAPKDNIMGEPSTDKNGPWDRLKSVIALVHGDFFAPGANRIPKLPSQLPTITKVPSKIILVARKPAEVTLPPPTALAHSGHSVSAFYRRKPQVDAAGAVGNNQQDDISRNALTYYPRTTRKRPRSELSRGSIDNQNENSLHYPYPLPQRLKIRLRPDIGVGAVAVAGRTIRVYPRPMLRNEALPPVSNEPRRSEQELKKQVLAPKPYTGRVGTMTRKACINWFEHTNVDNITAVLTKVFAKKGHDEKVSALCLQGKTKEQLIDIVKTMEDEDFQSRESAESWSKFAETVAQNQKWPRRWW